MFAAAAIDSAGDVPGIPALFKQILKLDKKLTSNETEHLNRYLTQVYL